MTGGARSLALSVAAEWDAKSRPASISGTALSVHSKSLAIAQHEVGVI